MRVLITQYRLRDFTGSEVSALELAEAFRGLGHEVDLLTEHQGQPFAHECEQRGFRILSRSRGVPSAPHDLYWVRHQLLPFAALRELRTARQPVVVFEHLSPFTLRERPFLGHLENRMASRILANSEETRQMLVDCLMDHDRIEVFDNPAPGAFLCEEPPRSELRSVLVVSNHPPSEVLQAVRGLRRRGISVTTVGRHFDNEIPVTPGLLRAHDAVVTIGKTFQYALLARRPVFLYDHFGGPGYLLDDGMFELARIRNFSGRGFNDRLGASEIEERIVSDYQTAVRTCDAYRARHLERFVLEERLEKVLSGLAGAAVRFFPSELESVAASATHDLIVDQQEKINRLEQEVSHPGRQLVRAAARRVRRELQLREPRWLPRNSRQ